MQCVTTYTDPTTHKLLLVADTLDDPPNCALYLMDGTDYSTFVSLSSATPPSLPFTQDQITALQYLADNPSPFTLSIPDAETIGVAILAVWAAAFAFRAIARSLSGGFSSNEE
jgi:hypothetical protein